MIQPKRAPSGVTQAKALLRSALCMSALITCAQAAPPSPPGIPSFEAVPTLEKNAPTKLLPQGVLQSGCDAAVLNCQLTNVSLQGQVTKLIGIGKRQAAGSNLESTPQSLPANGSLTIPNPSWLDVALDEKLRVDTTTSHSPSMEQAADDSISGALTQGSTPEFEFTSAVFPLAGQVANAPLSSSPIAAPTASTLAIPAFEPITLASAAVEPSPSEQAKSASESLIDVVIPDIFSTVAEPIPEPSRPSETVKKVAPIAKATSERANVSIQMQIGKARPVQAAQQPKTRPAAETPTNLPSQIVVTANPVVIALGTDVQPLANFRLSDAPLDSTGVAVPSKELGQGVAEIQSRVATKNNPPAPSKMNAQDTPSKVPSQGTLLSSGSDNRLSIRIRAKDAPKSPLTNSSNPQSHTNQLTTKQIISDQSRHSATDRPKPIVQAVQPAKHTAAEEHSSLADRRSFEAMIAGLPEGTTQEKVDLQLRKFQTVELEGAIVELRIEDDSICQVMKTGIQSLSAIGLKGGTTRLAVLLELAGKRSQRVMTIRVASANETAAPLDQLAEGLTRTLQALYATSKIEVIAIQEELLVRGVASSEQEAQAIMSFVRRTTLRPVTDRVVTRR